MATDPRRAESLERLPLPYATALRLRDAGVADDVIAQSVGVDPDALPTFMRVAEAKLAAASDESEESPTSQLFSRAPIFALVESANRTPVPVKICR